MCWVPIGTAFKLSAIIILYYYNIIALPRSIVSMAMMLFDPIMEHVTPFVRIIM